MVDAQTISIIFAGVSIGVAAIYYSFTIRNQNRTRQAQLFMNLYETYRSPEFRKQWAMIFQQEWTDIDDFMEKYGLRNNPDAYANWMSVASYYHGIGVLVKKGFLHPRLLDEFIAPNVFQAWVKMGPIVKGFVEYVKRASMRRSHDAEGHGFSKIFEAFSGFEYLYDELKRREQQLLKLKA